MGACTPILMGPLAATAVPRPIVSEATAVIAESFVSLFISGFS
jgi:hypothetical protein